MSNLFYQFFIRNIIASQILAQNPFGLCYFQRASSLWSSTFSRLVVLLLRASNVQSTWCAMQSNAAKFTAHLSPVESVYAWSRVAQRDRSNQI